jgi:type II secretory pathway pseudopilin PulG
MFSLFLPSRSNSVPAAQAGFGLIELIVSISILILITTLVLVNQNAFNSAILLRSQAYELALQLRTVQLNAVSAADEAGAGTFRSVFGVHFNTATPQEYKLFRDTGNYYYDGLGEEFGLQGSLDPRFEIRAIRADGAVVAGGELSVVFERPNFDARFFDTPGEINALDVGRVEIEVARVGEAGTTADVLRTVVVTSAGQISVQ